MAQAANGKDKVAAAMRRAAFEACEAASQRAAWAAERGRAAANEVGSCVVLTWF
jgi:hypothetical protein